MSQISFKTLCKTCSLSLVLLVVSTSRIVAAEPDWTLYDELLTQYVSSGETSGITLNRIHYSKLKEDSRWQELVDGIETFPLEKLQSEEEVLAFYINAYNILAIDTVLEHWPVKSIKDVGSWLRPVWKREAGILGGEAVSLDYIEHNVLRKLNEPRIHFAIVCASLSCPDLRIEAFKADLLGAQLDDQLSKFLANSSKGLRLTSKGAEISKIFDWFEEDFDKEGGIAAFIESSTGHSINLDGFIPYDWDVNGH